MTSNGLPIESFRGFACFFLRGSYSCPSLKLWGFSSETSLHRAINRASPKSVVNRWGHKLTVGQRVRFVMPRGGKEEGTISRFDCAGEFVRAYGKRVAFSDSPYSAGVDDCAPIE